MKSSSLLIGLLIGGLAGFVLTNHFQPKPEPKHQSSPNQMAGWTWPDSLDSVKAAPGSHKIIFENDKVRIPEVSVAPKGFEPMHTHRFPSISFGPDGDTTSFDIKYYAYGFDTAKSVYFIRDSVLQHAGGQSSTQNKGDYMRPEGPHRIKNLSNVRIYFFRVKLKGSDLTE